MKQMRVRIAVAMLATASLCSVARASWICTLGPGVAPAGPVFYPWTFTNANIITSTAIGARTGPPPPFFVTGVGLNGSLFPRPYFALATVLNTGRVGAILARNESVDPDYQFTGWNPGEAITVSDVSCNVDGSDYSLVSMGLMNIGNLGSFDELSPLASIVAPDAAGEVPYMIFEQVPGPGALTAMAFGGLLMGTRRRRI